MLRIHDLRRRIHQLEDAFAGRHGRLQNVVLVAQILNWPPEPQRIQNEHVERADGHNAREHREAPAPHHQRDRHRRKDIDGGVIERVRKNGVLEGDHVQAIDVLKVLESALFAVEQLHHRHPRNMLLRKAVDARDGGADAAVALAHMVAKKARGNQDQRQHGEGDEGQPPVDAEHDRGHDGEVEKVVEDGQHAAGKHFVDGVYVGGEASDQAAHGVGVEEADVHALHVAEDVAAQVEHDLLAGPLHQIRLNELKNVRTEQGKKIDFGQFRDPFVRISRQPPCEPVGGRPSIPCQVAVDGDLDEVWAGDITERF